MTRDVSTKYHRITKLMFNVPRSFRFLDSEIILSAVFGCREVIERPRYAQMIQTRF